MKNLKSLSCWAKKHPWTARTIIVVSHIILAACSVYWGLLLYAKHIHLSSSWQYASIGLFVITVLLYPIKGSSSRIWRHSFTKQKTADVSLVICGILLMTTFSNQCFVDFTRAIPTSSKMTVSLASFSHSENQPNVSLPNYKSKRQKRKHFKQALKRSLKQLRKERDTVADVIVILLSITLSVLLITLLSYFACALYCNGLPALGAIVFIGGGASIIALNAALIKKIVEKKGEKQKKAA